MAAASYSSSAIISLEKHDVFISFRGEDTRRGFTSHLYDALLKAGIQVYIDNKLDKGDVIGSALLKAISESKLSVIVFSENYASSSWCLDELVHIFQCRDSQFVIPIFYKVDPSDVRKQSGSYADAFVKHEKRFEDYKLKAWRKALTTAGSISGFDSNSKEISTDAKLVELLVKDVMTKLNRISHIEGGLNGLVGIEKHVQHVEWLLCLSSHHVQTLGIWGMGGIGKSTIAEVIFQRFASQFQACCFMANVREKSTTRVGLYELRDQLLGTILKEESLRVATASIGSTLMTRLSRTKSLVVLDDVNDLDQVNFLTGGDCIWFGPGSRIIVTTRDKRVLGVYDVEIYEVKELNCDEALDLFHLRALRNLSPTTEYATLSREVVDYAGGNPLALTVLGALFSHCRRKEDWNSELQKLKKFPVKKIQNALKLSYDALGANEKGIFLDIACFYRGKNIDAVERILESCGFSANAGVRLLIDMSLISVDKDSRKLQMHDLIQEMGREVVSDVNNLENGSRLWLANEQVSPALENNRGTKFIEGIVMNIDDLNSDLHVNAASFENMDNLRLLDIYSLSSYSTTAAPSSRFRKYGVNKMHLPPGFDFLPDTLTYLRWLFYPLPYLPSRFCSKNLVELRMCNSRLERLWNTDMQIDLRSLKHIELSRSKNLVELPDLSRSPNLEVINLRGCSNLVQLPLFQCHPKLTHIYLENCSSLRTLPALSKSPNLKSIHLQGCSSLVQLPSFQCHPKLTHLNLENCSSLTTLPDLSKSPNLKSIHLQGCSSLVQLPSFQCHDKLTHLYLENCSSLKILPQMPGNLEVLRLEGTAVEELPSSIWSLEKLTEINISMDDDRFTRDNCRLNLLRSLDQNGCYTLESLSVKLPVGLNKLDLTHCMHLVSLPIKLPAGLEELYLTNNYCSDISSLSMERLPAEPSKLFLSTFNGHPLLVNLPVELKILDLTYYNGRPFLVNDHPLRGRHSVEIMLPAWIEEPDSNNCNKLGSFLVDLPAGLSNLYVRDCRNLGALPIQLSAGLKLLNLSNCENIGSWLVELPAGLEEMSLSHCVNLCSLPAVLPAGLVSLNLSNCENIGSWLVELPAGLEELSLSHCVNLRSLPVVLPAGLVSLNLSNCENLGYLPVELPAGLKGLSLSHCVNLRSLPVVLPAGLVSLNLSNCENLGYLPVELPAGLEKLCSSHCVNLRSLPVVLPAGLESLNLSYCQNLGYLPVELPSGLYKLDLIGFKNLRSLPIVLPVGLSLLNLSYCENLGSLPVQLPAGLKRLSLSHCVNLRSLPVVLPAGLTWLNLCYCENLGSLPVELPAGLKRLSLSHCVNLRSLPVVLPAGLTWLNLCYCENLGSLPVELPAGLKRLSVSHCVNLRSLPVVLPAGLTWLSLCYCENLGSLPVQLPARLRNLFLGGCKNLILPEWISSSATVTHKGLIVGMDELRFAPRRRFR